MTDPVRTEDQIKYMVDRFLGWKLPSNFNPDAGISFKAAFNEHTAHPMKHGPTGTNLFDAEQASAMVRYLIEGMPKSAAPTESLIHISRECASAPRSQATVADASSGERVNG